MTILPIRVPIPDHGPQIRGGKQRRRHTPIARVARAGGLQVVLRRATTAAPLAPTVFTRVQAVDVVVRAGHIVDTDLRVADAAGGEVFRVERGGWGAAVEELPVGAVAGAEEEIGAGGPAGGEHGVEEVVEVLVGVGEVGQGKGGVGDGVVPPGAAEAVGVVAVALDEGGGGEGAVVGEGVRRGVAREGDDDVVEGEGLRDDGGCEGGGQVDGLDLEVGARGDEAAIEGKEGEGRIVILDESQGAGDVGLVAGFDLG